MQLARVLGQVVATAKDPGLGSFTLLLVQDTTGADLGRISGPAYVALDLIGAGEGELVLVSRGSAARVTPESEKAPSDSAVVGIVDSVIRHGSVRYRKS